MILIFWFFRYETRQGVETSAVNHYITAVKNKIEELNPVLQSANKSSKLLTVKKVQEKQMDDTQVNFQPEKLGKLVVAIMDSSKMKKRMTRILKATRPDRLDQDTTMKFLYSQILILGNGQRGHTISLMKIHEFDNPAQAENDFKVVYCAEHKTASFSRTAPIVSPPDIYKVIKVYINLFRYILYSIFRVIYSSMLTMSYS